jgi:dienelactone hydrolase
VIEQLKQEELLLNFNQIILGGHSNGGDITKYFINNNPSVAPKAILFDARRAKLKPKMPLSVLMFEADDTTTDSGVIADPIQGNNAMRTNLDLRIIKPSGALHASYSDNFKDEKLKQNIFDYLDWFLKI